MQKHVSELSLFSLVGLLALGVSAPAQAGMNTTSLSHEIVLSDLQQPWNMAFLPDVTMLFTEKCQGLFVMLPSGDVNALLGMSGTEGYAVAADDLFCEGQAGMNGVALIPVLRKIGRSMSTQHPLSRLRRPTACCA